MSNEITFIDSAKKYMAEARTVGAIFHSDGSFASTAPLHPKLSDHLRVLRSDIALVVAEEDAKVLSKR